MLRFPEKNPAPALHDSEESGVCASILRKINHMTLTNSVNSSLHITCVEKLLVTRFIDLFSDVVDLGLLYVELPARPYCCERCTLHSAGE